jgi:hypothetical protein
MALDKLAELCEAHDGSSSIGVGRPASHNSRNSTGANSMSAKQALPPRGLPAYRILTGPDDAAFCRRVSEALALGYRLYGSPAATFDGQHVIVAQALVWPSLLKQVSTARGLTAPRSARRSRPR